MVPLPLNDPILATGIAPLYTEKTGDANPGSAKGTQYRREQTPSDSRSPVMRWPADGLYQPPLQTRVTNQDTAELGRRQNRTGTSCRATQCVQRRTGMARVAIFSRLAHLFARHLQAYRNDGLLHPATQKRAHTFCAARPCMSSTWQVLHR